MKSLKFFILAAVSALAFTFSSCDDDEKKPKGEFQAGIFVVNEGNFQDADGSVSFINPSSGEVTQDLFGTVNGGRALGDVVQFMTVEGDFAYIVVNNSNKMEVVDANTFVASYTIEDLKLPRYFTTFNGKGYVTEWVSFSDPGRVSVVDLQSHTVTGTIVTDYGSEDIVAANGKLFVSNNFTNTVSVIDPVSTAVVKTIEVGNSPAEFVIDGQNKIWVACGGGYDQNFNPLNDGKLVQIDPASSTVMKTIPLGINFSGKLAINNTGNQLFYYKGKSVYRLGTADTAPPSSALITESDAVSFYGIGIDPKTDVLYLADAKAFSGNGTAFTYNTSGTAIGSHAVGRGPNGFVFNY
jgi:YVTN family beta-propeller protein